MKMNVTVGGGIAVAAIALVVSGVATAPSIAKPAKGFRCIGASACKGIASCQASHGHKRVTFEKSKAACIRLGGRPG